MERRTSAATRILAAVALIGAVLAVVVAISIGMDADSPSRDNDRSSQQTQKEKKPKRSKAQTYTIQSGDTLTAIAQKTGVPVAELQALNPQVDPHTLIAGETLKLR